MLAFLLSSAFVVIVALAIVFARMSVLSLFLCCLLQAQQLPFRTFTSRDGLPRSEVRTLCQDSLGYIWIGTFDGFSRYDGASFANYEIPGGLGANAVNSLFARAEGELLVATNGGGLSRWDAGKIRRYPVDPRDPLSQENRVNAVSAFGPGRVLAGTDRGAFLFDGDRFERFRPESIPASAAVDVLFRDRTGATWIGTSAGLFVVRDSAGTPCRKFDLPGSPHLNAIAGDTAGGIWLATDAGIRLLRVGVGPAELPRLAQLPSPLRALSLKRARALLVDRQGTLWIGTEEDGLFRYSAGFLVNYTTTNGLPGSQQGACFVLNACLPTFVAANNARQVIHSRELT
jgi:ligand-binding sensor domain-containing protein